MKQRILLLMLFFCAAAAFRLDAQGMTSIGTSAANFLKIGMGAKTVGVAESDITAGEDASSLYWNPGALSKVQHPSIVFSSNSWLVETNVTYLAFSMPMSFGTLGFDLTYFGTGDIEETTLELQDGTGRMTSANDMALGFGYSRALTDRFSVGVKVKYVREQLASVSSDALGIDIGTVFATGIAGNMVLGLALTNFGGSMRFDGNNLVVSHVVPGSPTGKQIPAVLQTNDWQLPLTFRIGLTSDFIDTESLKLTGSYAVTDSRDNGDRHTLGLACKLLNTVTFRGGYKINYGETKYALGGGVQFAGGPLGRMYVDYSFTDFGVLKGLHQVTLSINVE